MQQLPLYQVDAFASRPFAGNPAAVLVLDEWLSDHDMLAIAEENNIAITAFVRPNGDNWALRWFTPTMEASFCGHGTLATAHVLATERGIAGDFAFDTLAGLLRVSRDEDKYALDLPSLPPEAVMEVPPIIADIVGDRRQQAFVTTRHWIVVLESEEAVRGFTPDLEKIAMLHPLSFVVTAEGERHDFVSRHFAPGAGVPEDSVTGSTHSTLVPYWARKLDKNRLSAFQCSRRGGHLECEFDGDRVRIIGKAVTYLKGTVQLP
ncbi:hypothetical protein ADU59_21215 [Pararhizobium polonicum]|uniref:Phenazine biosynthesis protein PhzF family n=1 Tax=Pararhizobium polonicum TaxID=1612624 RepID=A0A1C7NWM5_9HYPH|nr:hypothetical protein ADU59_21215 [Pararhizobium polonicum]